MIYPSTFYIYICHGTSLLYQLKEEENHKLSDNSRLPLETMNRENWPLATDEPVEIQDLRKITDHFRGMYGTCLKLIKENPKDHNMWPVGLGNTRILTNCAEEFMANYCNQKQFTTLDHMEGRRHCLSGKL